MISLVLFLAFALFFASGLLGDRRGISSPFSAPEQALFGTCTSEDCVLGPAQGSSYFQSSSVEQVVPVSSTQQKHPLDDHNQQEQSDDTNASPDVDPAKEGRFGRHPTFVHHK